LPETGQRPPQVSQIERRELFRLGLDILITGLAGRFDPA